MKLYNKTYLYLLILVLCFCTACSFISGNTEQIQTNETKFNYTTYPLTVTDFTNEQTTIEKKPERIISLSPGITEILFSLGVGEKIVGVTNYDDYPPEVINIPKVGNFKGPNLEEIVQQKPDIILTSSLTGKEQIEVLKKMGFQVLMLQADNIEQIYDSIHTIGQITNTNVRSETLIKEMKTEILEISQKVKGLPKRKVFYLVQLQDNWTTGTGTFINELIELAGGENVAGDLNGWVKYSLEKLVQNNPEVIISAPHGGDLTALKTMAGYRETKAVINNQLFIISDDNIITRPSPRIVIGLQEIAKYLHPEAFK